MDNHIITVTVLCLVSGIGVIIPVSIAWLEHRTRMKGLETLRIYAERGQEPPASVIEAVTNVTNVYGVRIKWRPPQSMRAPQTRGNHLAIAAVNIVVTLGLAGLVWWRVSAYGEKGPGIIVGLLVALFFAAAFAAQLVYAYYAPSK